MLVDENVVHAREGNKNKSSMSMDLWDAERERLGGMSHQNGKYFPFKFPPTVKNSWSNANVQE